MYEGDENGDRVAEEERDREARKTVLRVTIGEDTGTGGEERDNGLPLAAVPPDCVLVSKCVPVRETAEDKSPS
jgi:hypothetical protein